MIQLIRRGCLIVGAVAVLSLLPSASSAAGMCRTPPAFSAALSQATANGSTKFLEAASEAFLAFKAVDQASDGFEGHAQRVRVLLEEAIIAYRAALELAADVPGMDKFLRDRPFEALRASLGITPGTVDYRRWEMIAKTAREAKTPAVDLIRVCVSSAESLKYFTSTVRLDTAPAQVRRAAAAWHYVLLHGALVSDAFDSSIR